MKLHLLHHDLCYISTGTGKMHARDDRGTHITLCGRNIAAGTEPQVSRQLDTAQLCGNCYGSLRTYAQVGKARIESEIRI